MKLTRVSVGIAVGLLVASTARAQTTVYQSNFSANTTGWTNAVNGVSQASTPSDCTATPYCGTFLGSGDGDPFSNDDANLTLTGLAPHSNVTVLFTLLLPSSWDGNTLGVGPDFFSVDANSTTIMHTTFTTFGSNTQCYPTLICNADVDNPANTDAVDVDNLGTGFTFLGSAVYNIELDFASSSPTLSLDFIGSDLQGWPDEGWGLNNVTVQTDAGPVSSTPEPASLVLMSTGLIGIAGVGIRRRRNA